MGSMYQLDSTVQQLKVFAAYDCPNDRSEIDFNDPTQQPTIEVEYIVDNNTDSENTNPVIGAWVYDPAYGNDWMPLDGPTLGFLRFFAWYKMTIGRFNSIGRTICGFRTFNDEIRLSMMLYTATNRYAINGKVNLMGDGNYLGCMASSRAPRPGEDWSRGSDLADGKFSKHTWDRIVGDMLSYELIDGGYNKVWGLFPDDKPGCSHSHERRLGYINPARSNSDGSNFIPESNMYPLH